VAKSELSGEHAEAEATGVKKRVIRSTFLFGVPSVLSAIPKSAHVRRVGNADNLNAPRSGRPNVRDARYTVKWRRAALAHYKFGEDCSQKEPPA
jgi:hypothetical protein